MMDPLPGPKGPEAYNYEPVFSEQELRRMRDAAAPAEESDGDGTDSGDDRPAPPDPPDRMNTRDWCTCGNCEPLDSPTQCVCCHEVGNCEQFLDNDEVNCVSDHEDFQPVCMHRAVLRTALVARLDCRGHARRRLPQILENVSYRYAAYRMFTYWTHGILGKGVRRVIPACVLKTIRQTFPADDGRYVGFKQGADGEQVPVIEELAI